MASVIVGKCQRGVSLIEVLVALFVLAVGLLGVFAMQATGIRSNQVSEFSTEAQYLAQDIIDRIMAYNDIDNPADDDDFEDRDTSDDDTANATDCFTAANGCARGEAQVNADFTEWSQQVKRRLPSGRGTIDFGAEAGGRPKYTITVMWDANLTGATGTQCNGGDNQLTCYEVEFVL